MSAGVAYADILNKQLKNVYDKRKPESLYNQEEVTFSKLSKSPKAPKGNGFYGSAIVAGNQAGLKSQNELEALATAGRQKVEQYVVKPKIITQTIQLSGLAMAVGEGDEASFADNLTLEMDEGLMDAKRERNNQLFRIGDGMIAQVNAAVTASTSLVFDGGIPTHFAIGELVDIFDSTASYAGVKQASAVEITDINYSTQTLTLGSAVTVDDNAYIFRAAANDNVPTGGKELSGLPAIVDDGTAVASYEGITRSGSGLISAWKGLNIAAGSINISDDLLQRAKAQMLVYSGKKPNKIISNTSQQRKYLTSTLPAVQYVDGAKRDSAVVGSPTWNGMEWIVDTSCGFAEVYLVNFDYIEKYEVKEMYFDNTDGKIIKHIPGTDTFMAYAKSYLNVGTRHPRGAAIRINGLLTPTF